MEKHEVEVPPAAKPPKVQQLAIKPANLRTVILKIEGDSPLVVNRFSNKALEEIMAKHRAGSQSKKGKMREAKDFDASFEGARHISEEGWDGFAASSIRRAAISACRLTGFKMTIAKLSVFVKPDGFDKEDGSPLVRIIAGEPEKHVGHVRNKTGVVDVRIRPMWRKWKANLSVEFDADQFSVLDVVNLIDRAGRQVGIGEGRPDSKDSAGMGWGTFHVERDAKAAIA